MNNYAKDLIKQKVILSETKKQDGFETIVIRLTPKHFAMLRTLSKNFDFSITSFFTETISNHLHDMVLSLNEEDIENFKEKFSHHDSLLYEGLIPGYGNTSLWLLQESKLLPEIELGF